MWAERFAQNLMDHSADALFTAFPYHSLKVKVGSRPIGFRFSSHIINIVADLNGQRIVATGEANSHELALAKAKSELFERSIFFSNAERLGAETTNGWAAHPDSLTAKRNAIHEAIERDAVLSQWYTSTPFLELTPGGWPTVITDWVANELARSEFPSLRILISTRGLGPSVTCILANQTGNGVSAHSTRTTLQESIYAAIAEACRAAHGAIRRDHWGDTLKLKSGQGLMTAAEAHAVYYAYHEPFPQWIYGPSVNWAYAEQLWNCQMENAERMDFTLTSVSASPLFVVFAKHPFALPLRWGNTEAEWVASLPAARRLGLHEGKLNLDIHIVA